MPLHPFALALLALAAVAAPTGPSSSTTAAVSTGPVPVAPSVVPYPGRRMSPDEVLHIAEALPVVRRERARNPGAYGGAYLDGPGRWQVSFFSRRAKEIVQIHIADATGRVLEQWTGFQVAWTMARGYPGAFGRHVNAVYLWLPLCVLFFAPFFDWRRPFSLLHLDLLVLLFFSVSLTFFNHARIGLSVPLAYPPLLYLLARMLALARPFRGGAPPPLPAGTPARPGPALRLLVGPLWLALGVVFLLGFRIALNVTDSNVIDVGYAGVIGAQRVASGRPLYGGYPADNEHGDTYGPVNYEAYVPFQQVFGWSGQWDDLPAAHAAAIFFDLLAVALLFLLGRRVRGPTLGIALAYAWVSYPFTLYALESNSNDTLVCVLVLAALLCATSAPARGVFAALAGLTKFAPLALAPLLATHGVRELPSRARRARALGAFALAFALTVAVVSIPALSHDSWHTIYERTFVYQTNRGSPFSVWGRCHLARSGPGRGAAPPRRGGSRRGGGGYHDRHPAGRRTLVLPLHPVVLWTGDARAAGAPHRPGGRGIRTCSIESARLAVEQRTSTPINHGSSSEVSKRTGICVTSASTACSRLTPITPPRAPVMPTSVM
jgi:hypothetical protein